MIFKKAAFLALALGLSSQSFAMDTHFCPNPSELNPNNFNPLSANFLYSFYNFDPIYSMPLPMGALQNLVNVKFEGAYRTPSHTEGQYIIICAYFFEVDQTLFLATQATYTTPLEGYSGNWTASNSCPADHLNPSVEDCPFPAQ